LRSRHTFDDPSATSHRGLGDSTVSQPIAIVGPQRDYADDWLAVVLAHNVWSGGALAVVVTVVGWAMLIKGLLFLFVYSGVELGFFLSMLRNPLHFYICMTPSLVIGLYLTYGRFTSKTARV
jgi:hypothetical protein